jgi:Putative Ig domain
VFTLKGILPVAAILVCTSFIAGCGKSAITITLNPTTTVTINQAATQAITATLTNDTTNQGVTWTLGTSVGTLTSQTKTTVTYVAPPVVSTSTTATVTATSVANSAITASLSITINPVLAIATPSLPVGTQNSPYFGVISATGGSGTFTWTLTSGSLPSGLTLSSSTSSSVTIDGTPTTTGTSKFTVQVTVGGSTVSQALSITINPPPPLSVGTKFLPNGTVGTAYSATLAASSGTAPYTWSIVGSLPTELSWLNLSPTGTISGTPITVTTQPAPTFEVQVTDSSSPQQTATATLSITVNPSTAFNSELSGNYAFLVSGYDPGGGRFMAAGDFVANGSAGTITDGVMDINDAGSVQTSVAFSGSYLIGNNGLGTISFDGRAFALSFVASGTPSVIQSANLIEFDGLDQDSGVLLQQNTGDFLTSAISGNYAFGFLGADSNTPPGRYALAGEFSASGGALTGMLDSDDASSGPSPSVAITSGSYSVVSNGRGTMVTTTAQGSANYSFYVVSNSQLLVIETDQVAGKTFPEVSGTALLQATSLSLNGISVFETTAEPTVSSSLVAQAQVGVLTTTGTSGSGTLSLSSDLNTNGTASTGASVCSPTLCTYTLAANGRATLTNSGFQTSDPVLYLINTNQAFIVGTDPAVTFGYMTPQAGPFTTASLSGTYAGGTMTPIGLSGINQLDVLIATPSASPPLTYTTDASSTSGLSQNQSSTQSYSLLSNGRGTIPVSGTPTQVFYMVSPSEYWTLFMGPIPAVETFQQ